MLGKKVFVVTVGFLGALMICVGILIVDPFTIKDRKLAFETLSNLMRAQNLVENRWNSEKKLPESLENFRGDSLTYKVISPNAYKLCAEFKLIIKNQNSKRNPYRNFIYEKNGLNCFRFTPGELRNKLI